MWDITTFLNDNGGCAVAVIACGPRGKGKEGRKEFHQVISELSQTKTSGLLSLDLILLSNQHQSFGGADLPDFVQKE